MKKGIRRRIISVAIGFILLAMAKYLRIFGLELGGDLGFLPAFLGILLIPVGILFIFIPIPYFRKPLLNVLFWIMPK